MARDASSPPAGPVALSSLFDDALRHIQPAHATTPLGDGLLFSGNRHETVPRRLFTDQRLTPLERNAWQVFRLLLNEDGVTAFPSYDQLSHYLASMPCSARASHETVARALTLLRLTRWLSLVRRRRDPKTGRILGNLYVLHDEPLTPFEAMQLDPDFLGLVSQALAHAAKAVQIVGLNTLSEIADDPLLSGRTLPTRLQVLAQRVAQHGVRTDHPQDSADESEDGHDALLRIRIRPSSDSEAGSNPASNRSLRIPKQDRTVRKASIEEVRTVPRARELQNLRLPERFLALADEQQAGALVALQQVDSDQRQAVLDEWAARCRGSTVRNPAGYLFGIIQKALHGQFKAWAGQGDASAAGPATPNSAPPTPPASKPASPEAVQAHLARLRSILGKS